MGVLASDTFDAIESGATVTVPNSAKQIRVTYQGTYTGVTAPGQVSNDGSNWFSILGVREDNGAGFTGSLGAGNASVLFNVSGWSFFRTNATAFGTGSLTANQYAGNFSLPQGVTPISLSFASSVVTSAAANALTAGANGATNPAFNVDASASSAATGWNHVAAAAAGGVALAVISSGTNESGTIDAKGTGSIKINSVGGTGFVQLGGGASGNNATGLKVTPNAAASGLALAVVSTGSNENLTIDAKGSGTISLNVTGTGNIVLGRAATGVSLAVTAGLTSSGATGAGIGYATGAGGTVTQASSITTGVTLNTLTGTITTVSSTLAAGVDASFTVTNSTVAATDTIVINTKSYGGTADGIPICKVQSVAAGSFVVNVHNQGAVTLDAAIVMSFAVIKGVAA